MMSDRSDRLAVFLFVAVAFSVFSVSDRDNRLGRKINSSIVKKWIFIEHRN